MASIVGGGLVLGGRWFAVSTNLANRHLADFGFVDGVLQPVLAQWHAMAACLAQYLVGTGIVLAFDGGLVLVGAAITRAVVAITHSAKYL